MNITKSITKFSKAFTSVEYYKEATNKPLFKSFLFFFSAILIVGWIQGVSFVTKYTQSSIKTIESIHSDFISHYPDDLSFTWDTNQLTYQFESEEVSPDYISVPFSSTLPISEGILPNNFLYITKHEITPDTEGLSTQDYVFIVTPTKLFLAETNSKNLWTEYSLNSLFEIDSSVTLTKPIVETVTTESITALKLNKAYIQIVIIGMFGLLFLFNKIWFLFIETIFVLILFKLNSIKLSLKQVISLSIHILITTAIITTVAQLLYGNIHFPLHTIAYWVVLFYIIFQWKKIK